jgi:hypothetical protein
VIPAQNVKAKRMQMSQVSDLPENHRPFGRVGTLRLKPNQLARVMLLAPCSIGRLVSA